MRSQLDKLDARCRFYRRKIKYLKDMLAAQGVTSVQLTPAEKLSRYATRRNDALVDFDSTLCEWAYPEFGEPTEGAAAAMAALKAQGWRIVIWTARMDRSIYPLSERMETKRAIALWCEKHNIHYDEIDIGNYGKRVCGIIIDDKNIHFCGDWQDVLRAAKALREIDEEKFQNTQEVYGGKTDRPGRSDPADGGADG